MTPSKHSLERRISQLPDEAEDEPTTADLWQRFIDGEYDPADPHPTIAGWIRLVGRCEESGDTPGNA